MVISSVGWLKVEMIGKDRFIVYVLHWSYLLWADWTWKCWESISSLYMSYIGHIFFGLTKSGNDGKAKAHRICPTLFISSVGWLNVEMMGKQRLIVYVLHWSYLLQADISSKLRSYIPVVLLVVRHLHKITFIASYE